MNENFYNEFKQLGAAETPPPMHLFAEIDQRRGFLDRLGNHLFVYKSYLLGGVGTLVVLLLLGSTQLASYADDRVALSSFEGGHATAGPVRTSATSSAIPAAESPLPSPAPLTAAAIATSGKKSTGSTESNQRTSANNSIPGERSGAFADSEQSGASPVVNEKAQRILPPALPVTVSTEKRSASEITANESATPPSNSRIGLQALPGTTTLLDLDLPEPLGCYWGGSRTNIDYSLELLAGGLYDFRELTARFPENQTYADDRNQTEEAWYGFGGTFRASVLLNDHVAIRLGLDYQQINEKFRYTEPGEIRIVTQEIFGPDGQVIGVETDTVVGVRDVQWTNEYRVIGVPAMLGYELDLGNLLLTVNGGASFNVATARRGRILSPGGEVRSIDTGTPDADDPPAAEAYKTLVGTSLIGSIGLNYELRSNLYLVVEPQFRYYLKPFTRQEFPVEHRHSNVGLQLGLRVNL